MTVKTVNAYDDFKPWMIGEKVEINVYTNEDGRWEGSSAGILNWYSSAVGSLVGWHVGPEGSGAEKADPSEQSILISVVEEI